MNADNWAREEQRRYKKEAGPAIGDTVIKHYCGGIAVGTILKINRQSYRIHFPKQPGTQEHTATLPKQRLTVLQTTVKYRHE